MLTLPPVSPHPGPHPSVGAREKLRQLLREAGHVVARSPPPRGRVGGRGETDGSAEMRLAEVQRKRIIDTPALGLVMFSTG